MSPLQLLSRFHDEWFATERWWFHATPEDDEYISKQFASLLSEGIFDAQEYSNLPPHLQVTTIIVHDQLPRHSFRTGALSPLDKDRVISRHLHLYAIPYANHLQAALKDLTSEQVTFALLPYRHTGSHGAVFYAIDQAWSLLKSNEKHNNRRIKRFLKAAYARAPMNQADLIKVQHKQKPLAHIDFTTPEEFRMRHVQVLCPSCNVVSSTDSANNQTLIAAVSKQLSEHKLTNKPLIVSLSGGVDSMVLCNILVRHLDITQITAVHIDYANRESSANEAVFVSEWCYALGINCVTRRISEIHRPTCMQYGLRSAYETYTRKVRYNTYKAAAAAEQAGMADCIVGMGHNFNDSFENIMTNIAHHTKYDNLVGMETLSDHEGIAFWRPFLGITKEQIYQYANANKIPYLYDSTVSWCQRGKIRDTIYPAVAQWHPQAFKGFYDLSTHLTEMYGVLDSLVDAYAAQAPTIQIPTTFSAMSNELFWRRLISKTTNMHVSRASLANYILRLKHIATSPDCVTTRTKTMLSKTLSVSITKRKKQPNQVELAFSIASAASVAAVAAAVGAGA